MDRISGLSDELLVKTLSFVPTKVAVSSSVLSKRWESLWMWVPKLEIMTNCYGEDPGLGDFINKNLPLLRAPVTESFRLKCFSSFQLEDISQWVAITVSRCVRELDLDCTQFRYLGKPEAAILLPSSLYTCKSLATLRLNGCRILVDVPRTVSLPSLKTLLLRSVKYSSRDSLRLLLSYCPVLEDLIINRHSSHDNAKGVVVISPSLQRLTLPIGGASHSSDEYVIATPSLKYFKIEDSYVQRFSYLMMHMPEVEEAKIVVEEHLEKLLESITSVKRLSLYVMHNSGEEHLYHDGIVFNNLENLKFCISFDDWSSLLFRLLQDSPKLRVLKLYADVEGRFKMYRPVSRNNKISVPSFLLESLETFEFADYRGSQEERDFVCFIFKNACRLKSSSITPCNRDEETSSSSASESSSSALESSDD